MADKFNKLFEYLHSFEDLTRDEIEARLPGIIELLLYEIQALFEGNVKFVKSYVYLNDDGYNQGDELGINLSNLNSV